VIDYQIAYSSGVEYQTLASGLTTQTYTAISLYPGTTYSFKVLSRNSFGQSSYSAPTTILVA
jgi:hypothetical protein